MTDGWVLSGLVLEDHKTLMSSRRWLPARVRITTYIMFIYHCLFSTFRFESVIITPAQQNNPTMWWCMWQSVTNILARIFSSLGLCEYRLLWCVSGLYFYWWVIASEREGALKSFGQWARIYVDVSVMSWISNRPMNTYFGNNGSLICSQKATLIKRACAKTTQRQARAIRH